MYIYLWALLALARCTYITVGSVHRVHIGVEQKQWECICTLSWSVHHNFARDGRCSERHVHGAPPTLTRLDWFFHHNWMATFWRACTPESGHCHYIRVCSVGCTIFSLCFLSYNLFLWTVFLGACLLEKANPTCGIKGLMANENF
jgi:hypothetical protein